MSLSSQQGLKWQSRINRVFLGPGVGNIVSKHQKKIYERNPELADPLNITDAQQLKVDREEQKRYQGVVTRAKQLQEDVNKKYRLGGNLTILGG